jgi:hypothetical protein
MTLAQIHFAFLGLLLAFVFHASMMYVLSSNEAQYD